MNKIEDALIAVCSEIRNFDVRIDGLYKDGKVTDKYMEIHGYRMGKLNESLTVIIKQYSVDRELHRKIDELKKEILSSVLSFIKKINPFKNKSDYITVKEHTAMIHKITDLLVADGYVLKYTDRFELVKDGKIVYSGWNLGELTDSIK